jgi:hypothetical protein
MKLSSKLTVAIATAAVAAVVFPIAANAGPSTGSTAATVSIKFNDCNCSPTSGGFSITPGGTATGNGNGVKELSAAVATGETKAEATSMSNHSGTSARAEGYSKPVSFMYVSTSDTKNTIDTTNYSYNSTSQENKAKQSASTKRLSDYETYNTANATNGNATNGTKGDGTTRNITANSASGTASDGSGDSSTSSKMKDSSSYSTSSNNSSGNDNGTSGSSTDKAKSKSSNSQNGLTTAEVDNTSNTLNTTNKSTTYDYTGSSAGLSYIPMIK